MEARHAGSGWERRVSLSGCHRTPPGGLVLRAAANVAAVNVFVLLGIGGLVFGVTASPFSAGLLAALAVYALGCFFVGVRGYGRSRLVVEEDGVVIVGPWYVRSVPWSGIEDFEVGSNLLGGQILTVLTTSGTLKVFGVESTQFPTILGRRSVVERHRDFLRARLAEARGGAAEATTAYLGQDRSVRIQLVVYGVAYVALMLWFWHIDTFGS